MGELICAESLTWVISSFSHLYQVNLLLRAVVKTEKLMYIYKVAPCHFLRKSM